MRKGLKVTAAAVVLLVASIWLMMTESITAVWLTEEIRFFGLVMLPSAIAAGLLVLYFDWRAKLLNRIRAESREYRKAA